MAPPKSGPANLADSIVWIRLRQRNNAAARVLRFLNVRRFRLDE